MTPPGTFATRPAAQVAAELMSLAEKMQSADGPRIAVQRRWDKLLDSLLSHPSPAWAQAVQDAYIASAMADEQQIYFLSLFDESYKHLSERARLGESPYRLFALPLLMPAPDATMALDKERLAGAMGALVDHQAVTEHQPVALLPMLVPVSYLIHFSEWLVARVGQLLARGDRQAALELVRVEVEKLESTSNSPSREASQSLTFAALIGVVEGDADPFPLCQQLDALRADTESSEEDIDQSLCEALSHLEDLGASLGNVLQTSVLEVFNEPQGFWADLLLCEADMRDMELRQQVQDHLSQHSLSEEDVLVAYQAEELEGVSGVYLSLYLKRDLHKLGELYFPALRFEAQEECAEEALAVLANHGVTLVAASVLSQTPDEEGNDRPQGWLH